MLKSLKVAATMPASFSEDGVDRKGHRKSVPHFVFGRLVSSWAVA